MGLMEKIFGGNGGNSPTGPDPADVSHHTFIMKSAFDNEGEGTTDPLPAHIKDVMVKARDVFPGAITAKNLVRATQKVLAVDQKFDTSKTILASSFCCDEVNRDLEDDFRSIYGNNFHMGGIAGFPFGGVTSFGAFLHHIPTDGFALVVYGPHVGIDWDGVVGKVNRKGQQGSGACCNTAIAAMHYVQAVQSGHTLSNTPDPSDPIDAQQVFVNSALLQHGERLSKAQDPHIELPYALLDCQKHLMDRIMTKCCDDIPENVTIALLGGIHINTPEGVPEYFLPKSFHIVDREEGGGVKEDILSNLVEEALNDPKEKMLARVAAAKAKKEEKHMEKYTYG